MSDDKSSLIAIVDSIDHEISSDRVSIDNIVDVIGHASFSSLLLVPAIAVATPLSGIPLFSSAMGIIIFLVSAQMMIGRDHIWLPAWLLRREVNSARMKSAFSRLRPALSWLDQHTHRRLSVFARRPLKIIPQTLCVLSGFMMPFLELIPFSSSVMGIGVMLLALGMLTRDGVIVLLASVPYVGVAALLIYFM